MEGLKQIPFVALMLVVATVVLAAGAITLGQFSATTTDTTALAVISNGSSALSTVGNQLTTIGIIAAMVVIIGLIVGVLVYFQFFRGR